VIKKEGNGVVDRLEDMKRSLEGKSGKELKSKALKFRVRRDCKETKSEETVAFTLRLIYKYRM